MVCSHSSQILYVSKELTLCSDQDAPLLSRLRARKSGGRAIRSNSHSVTYAQLLMTCHNENKLTGCRYAINMLPQGMTAHKHHMAHHQRLAMRLGVSHCLCVLAHVHSCMRAFAVKVFVDNCKEEGNQLHSSNPLIEMLRKQFVLQ